MDLNINNRGGAIMRFQTEVWERYSEAQNRAKRTLRKKEVENTLCTLEAVLEQEKTAGEVELGVYEIPVNRIVGIASDSDKECYTAEFLPLPSIKSGFAEKWCNLYLEHLSDKGLLEPIRCYEYLGKFYVVGGKKRTSVIKVNGDMLIRAEIIRILPAETEDPKIQSYYQFVRTFKKTGVYQIAFSNPCDLDAFLESMGYDPNYVWTDSDRWGFHFRWYPFERGLKLAFNGYLNITAADAVKVLMKKYPYAELKQMPSWTIAELMQESWRELYKISNPNFTIGTTAA